MLKEQAAIPSDAGHKLHSIAADLAVKHKEAADRAFLTAVERQILKSSADETERIAVVIDGPSAEAQVSAVVADLTAVVNNLNNVAAPTESMRQPEKAFRASVGLLRGQVADIR
ncbi:MAG: hypothetical protein ABT940_15230, partial [Alphaproteobacteria bacterium]